MPNSFSSPTSPPHIHSFITLHVSLSLSLSLFKSNPHSHPSLVLQSSLYVIINPKVLDTIWHRKVTLIAAGEAVVAGDNTEKALKKKVIENRYVKGLYC
ncbi:unnamed protein product [Trifolium pratense]|uniref:Uncharacterized protein n=1 Tax=Trifolium pratense TaxID=57577 RepID=A0ACB0IMW1_TRIPR|nr:unnamed protein product [Trifolium pratense]